MFHIRPPSTRFVNVFKFLGLNRITRVVYRACLCNNISNDLHGYTSYDVINPLKMAAPRVQLVNKWIISSLVICVG